MMTHGHTATVPARQRCTQNQLDSRSPSQLRLSSTTRAAPLSGSDLA